MPTPLLTAAVRYYAPGTRKYYFVPAIATQASPSRAELNAGTDITNQVTAVKGFTVKSDFIDAPDFGSRFVAQVAGRITPDDSSFTIYMSLSTADVRTLLTRDLAGFITVMWEGDVTGRKMSVYPIVVAAQSPENSDSDAARMEVPVAFSGVPSEMVAIP